MLAPIWNPGRRLACAAIAIVFYLASTGCFSLPEQIAQEQFKADIAALSPETVSLHDKIPYKESQGKDSCGLTCLDMIFGYHQLTLPEKDIAPLRAKAAQESGVSVNDIVGLLQEAGFKTLRRQGRLAWPGSVAPGEIWFKDINNPLSQIHFLRPVILHLKLDSGSEHFVLLVGFDEPRRKYILLNPGVGPVVVEADRLEQMWAAGEHVFVAYKPPDSAKTPGAVEPATPSTPPAPAAPAAPAESTGANKPAEPPAPSAPLPASPATPGK